MSRQVISKVVRGRYKSFEENYAFEYPRLYKITTKQGTSPFFANHPPHTVNKNLVLGDATSALLLLTTEEKHVSQWHSDEPLLLSRSSASSLTWRVILAG